MDLDRACIYRDFAITSGEAVNLLQLDWPSYLSFVKSGMLMRSLDLCELRPGAFKAHSFWDLVGFAVSEQLKSLDHAESRNENIQINGILDEIATALETLDGELGRAGTAYFASVLNMCIEASLAAHHRPVSSKITQIWSELECRLIAMLQLN